MIVHVLHQRGFAIVEECPDDIDPYVHWVQPGGKFKLASGAGGPGQPDVS
jgi:hypothetical protein